MNRRWATVIVIGLVLSVGLSQRSHAELGSSGTNLTTGVKTRANRSGEGLDNAGGKITTTPGSTKLPGDCVDYNIVMPGLNKLDANSVVDPESMSPTRLQADWFVADHVGVIDSAFTGARHIVKRESGVQWFGYDAAPNNDILLMEYTGSIYNINVKQAPVRADWHTINGSGIVFGADLGGTGGSKRELGFGAPNTFSGYAFVATQEFIEIRYYPPTNLSTFSKGGSEFKTLYQIAKKCNSQSLTIDFSQETPKFKVGSMELDAVIDYKPTGNYIGAMVDYQQHDCSSLSTVFMFNYTVNGENFF